jgi:uncharacterized protein YbcC (UPF0753/DUF2309 family)
MALLILDDQLLLWRRKSGLFSSWRSLAQISLQVQIQQVRVTLAPLWA